MTHDSPEQKQHLTSIAEDMGSGGDASNAHVTVGEIIESIERRGFAALITFLSLFVILPTGAIPGVPGVCAFLIIIFAMQCLLGLKTLPLPSQITGFPISRNKMNRILEKARPILHRVDRLIHPRLQFLSNPLMERLIAGICILLAITFFPLGFIPFATLIPALAMLLMSVGLLARDGVWILVGMGVVAGGTALILPHLNHIPGLGG